MWIVTLLAAIATGLPNITVIPSGGGYVAKAGPFELALSEAVESDIAQRAAELCSGQDVQWGNFGSQTELGRMPVTTPPQVTGFYKEFRCIVAEKLSFTPASDDWKATAGDEADVRRFFTRYYTARDAGRTEDALGMFASEVVSDRATWNSGVRDFNKTAGEGERKIIKITWYVNPDGAPRSGIYAALDFEGDHRNLLFYCGYLMLYRKAAESYQIVREEQYMADRPAPGETETLDSMRTSLCRK